MIIEACFDLCGRLVQGWETDGIWIPTSWTQSVVIAGGRQKEQTRKRERERERRREVISLNSPKWFSLERGFYIAFAHGHRCASAESLGLPLSTASFVAAAWPCSLWPFPPCPFRRHVTRFPRWKINGPFVIWFFCRGTSPRRRLAMCCASKLHVRTCPEHFLWNTKRTPTRIGPDSGRVLSRE